VDSKKHLKLLPFAIFRRLTTTALLTLSIGLLADTYYIGFDAGNNQSDGRSPTSAWKQSPGDQQATDNPAAAKLQPGDTALFKGGVK
jgi:hypothetical protein